ncbi:MAG: hypothetical protein KDC43_04435, partial [Saprospiraceae bacterium]|nr:hypothetical protein [Saprospiraceae bacterium]
MPPKLQITPQTARTDKPAVCPATPMAPALQPTAAGWPTNHWLKSRCHWLKIFAKPLPCSFLCARQSQFSNRYKNRKMKDLMITALALLLAASITLTSCQQEEAEPV